MKSASLKRACLPLLLVPLVTVLSGCGTEQDSAPATSTDTGTDGAADVDADHLTSSEEAALGTDPEDPDSDGDGYLDGDEVLEETDPLDPESRIYQGGWPYQRFRTRSPTPGSAAPRRSEA